MTRSTTAPRLPWEDRWSEPTVDQLLESVDPEPRGLLEMIVRELDGFDGVAQQVVWYGPGWNWTIQYQIQVAVDAPTNILCYLVPKRERPVVCVPLRARDINRLPVKRLNRIIREGIRNAKCAVTVSWATFTPSNESDAEHLVDLIKRKHKGAADESRTEPKRTRRKRQA